MINKTIKMYFCFLCISILLIVITFPYTVSAYVFKRDPDKMIIPGDSGEILVYFGSNHKDEVKNFATISESLDCFGSNTRINDFIFKKPSTNNEYNDIDNVIYMIDKLDKLALSYANNDRRKANNCVFGYIRGINKNYTAKDERSDKSMYDNFNFSDLVGGTWGATAGKIDKGFVNYVAENEKEGEITFPEFFASFIQNRNDYNSYFYGKVDDAFLNKAYLVPDPLGTGQKIDLLHMFAAIDGIYENTERQEFVCYEAFGTRTYQRDLLSWLGDLHQFTYSVYGNGRTVNEYNISYGYIDFNDYIGANNFSSDDLLADIDAFNIVKFFIDCEKNSIRNSLLGYYTHINKNKATAGNRFYEFIYTATLELEQKKQASILDDFRMEVCSSMNINYNNGSYINYRYYIPSDLIRQNMKLLCVDYYPDAKTRGACAKLFCDYIIALSGR